MANSLIADNTPLLNSTLGSGMKACEELEWASPALSPIADQHNMRIMHEGMMK